MSSNYNVYYLQYGVYVNMDVLNNNVKNLKDYIIVNDYEKYYVYLGVFTNYDNALKVSKILEDDKKYTFIKNDYIENDELVNKLGEIDQKLLLTDNISEINKLVKETLNIYKK